MISTADISVRFVVVSTFSEKLSSVSLEETVRIFSLWSQYLSERCSVTVVLMLGTHTLAVTAAISAGGAATQWKDLNNASLLISQRYGTH